MENILNINLYGDSIMKATVPDENMKYRFRFSDYLAMAADLPVKIINKAHFGATAEKGSTILGRDIQRGLDCDYALIEFGGNDCDFNWCEIADTPDGEHLPHTPPERFTALLENMTDAVSAAGARPVLMTLPPIDAERYFRFICSRGGLDPKRILRWLGDINMIYRFQELYSDAIYKLSVRKNIACVDVRSVFLSDRGFKDLISADGIHLTVAGYARIFETLISELRKKLRSV